MTLDRLEFLQAVLAGAVGTTFTYRAFAQGTPPPLGDVRRGETLFFGARYTAVSSSPFRPAARSFTFALPKS